MATLHESEHLEALARITPQWLAGFFDGEGCVSVVRYRYGLPALRVDLIQSEYNILYLIGLKFGKQPTAKTRRNPMSKQGWCLSFGGKNAIPFLEFIRPHVVLKRKLVEWGIEMAKLHGESGGNRSGKRRFMDPGIRQRREELLQTIREENQSGSVRSKKAEEGLLQ